MAGIILDTNVVSELVAAGPEPRVLAWVAGQPPLMLYLTSVTIGELISGIVRRQEGRRRGELEAWVQGLLTRQFVDRILPLDEAAGVIWGELAGEGFRLGRPRPAIDMQIAAIARHRRFAVATRNVADFAGIGLTLIDPWAS